MFRLVVALCNGTCSNVLIDYDMTRRDRLHMTSPCPIPHSTFHEYRRQAASRQRL